MPKTGRKSTAAQQRENYKRGIIGIKAALELDADPTLTTPTTPGHVTMSLHTNSIQTT
jgi:hypothetical protein